MLALQVIRERRQEVIDRLKIKHVDAAELLDQIIRLDDLRRESQQQADELNARSKALAKEIGALFQSGKTEEASRLKEQTGDLKARSREAEAAMEQARRELDTLLVQLPNLPHSSVPPGTTAADNKLVHEEGLIPGLPGTALPHWDLVQRYRIIDFALGTRVTGAGFPVYLGKGARLQRALVNYFLDQALEAGYSEVQPPYLVNAASGFGTGQLPDKDGQMYHIPEDDLYLIPTAEVPVTNLYRDVILNPQDLPIRHVAYSACFRREAGSWGKEVRGLNRLHQFDKVEIVQITRPDHSYAVLEEMREYVAGLLRKLRFPFRIMKLCGADISFASAMTYDMEVYAAAQKRWLEVSSVSNFESFQALRMKLRIRDEAGKMQPAHTLNGSALALPRIVAALLENNQTPGGIRIPEVLVPYTGFDLIS
ncbi:MAG: serine--tRNA ligase [Bacteroidetes bacterium]|nr:MAG: serine--tRNA ligase [Bacteroidota bacterium]